MISYRTAGAAPRNSESGNVFFFILLAIVLIGLVTVALRSGGDQNIDKETLLIQASQVRQYASELERGVAFIMRDGSSETEIRFSNEVTGDYGVFDSAPTREVFNEKGGGVEYRLPPPEISTATQWEFYGHTHLPDVGTGAPELIAVLPHVNKAFCERINEMNGYNPATQPLDNTGDCINAVDSNPALRFTSGNLFSTGGAIDTTNEASFTVKPSMQGCVQCAANYHFFHVLMAR